ncbi:DUF7533 family protein [Halomicrobium salinisoli]|uniref:DUF7533 family protein n=1 Tax=Halomicrobium salinisoli TaxID=2878391 RepID=UPI001CF059BD|nr:hypothetical protein [Halomicrobium salinisoli]
MTRGILETFGLAGSVLLAAPPALFGAQRLVDGDALLGGGFLALATLMILVPQYAKTPDDVVVGTVERGVGWVVGGGDESE